jgi:hypothetical protein
MSTFADRLFAVHREHELVESELYAHVVRICEVKDQSRTEGTTLIAKPWTFEEITYDEYDRSFELKEADNDFVFTDDQWRQFVELGFSCAWICHCNGTEHYYSAIGVPRCAAADETGN